VAISREIEFSGGKEHFCRVDCPAFPGRFLGFFLFISVSLMVALFKE
jgi:hypothetical protein